MMSGTSGWIFWNQVQGIVAFGGLCYFGTLWWLNRKQADRNAE